MPFWPSAGELGIFVVILPPHCRSGIPGLTLFPRLFDQTGCSGPWISPSNNSSSAPIQLVERFGLVVFLNARPSDKEEKHAKAS